MRDLLQKLMFWKEDTVELDYEVAGCFTLPDDEDAASKTADQLADPAAQE